MLLDYSKAFDTVNHKLLLAKMQSLGLHSNALEWFLSYLTGRKQQVVDDKQKSEWRSIISGVPQGSILGPILFSIFVNDLRSNVNTNNMHMYVDDTQLYFHSPVSKTDELFF